MGALQPDGFVFSTLDLTERSAICRSRYALSAIRESDRLPFAFQHLLARRGHRLAEGTS
jgi:hypothetical protein